MISEYRRKPLENPNALSSESVDNRRAIMSLFSFVGGIGTLYGCKAHLVQYVLFLSPARDVLATASTSVSITDIPEGKTMIVKWRGKPIFITHRTQQVINTERAVNLADLRHPETDDQRVQRPEWLVIVGICTHLGCVPIPNAGNYPGGYFCPCHGSHFDGSGRTRKGPAPTNMEIPTYKFLDDNTLFIG
ncbi:cytochrome b-c1 complex subunit Rieske, mitochondrial isoform X2 [Cephus cinctus]|uniref:Cytochrome b-c1 complex subunit Rieske, mitochondrial n=1 Tax=Cephus cinctus TaxID=211228 RepID=A0AAJ7BJH9_CEPCN|nr:cytochrome b-c1 complex subunit Rieske, mitochondrial isoform X2 [Cephus cinctus]